MTTRATTIRTTLLTAPLLAAALVISGCGMNTPDEVISPTEQPSTPTNSDDSSATPDDQPEAETGGEDTAAQDGVTPQDAAEIAVEAHPETRVYEIELERSHGATVWEVNVVSDDGRYEVEVEASSGDVVSDREKSHDHLDKYNSRLDAATITYTEALEIMDDAHPGARLGEMELDDEDGAVVWEIELVTPDKVEYDLVIHAGTGEVLENERD